ncbi:MAG: hypothetical protein LBM23_00675 [Propionibacteriaceae bacterium]|jgi:hypothetical protein|nr:hypothetical protein [Propionibacteriaceae bacterium]
MTDFVDYYTELLSEDSDSSLETINSKLKLLKAQLSSRAMRPGSQREETLQQLELVEKALQVFKDEDSRERYDVELRRAKQSGSVSEAEINWTTRAWNYYFVGDIGAALVAARKAKEQSPKSAMPFVVSAWVRIRDEEWKLAKQDADEAFVLDDQVEDAVDVQMVRGTAYYMMGKHEKNIDPNEFYKRSLASYEKALSKASPGERADIFWRRADVYEELGMEKLAYEDDVQGLSVEYEIPTYLRQGLEVDLARHVYNLCGGRVGKYQDLKNILNSYTQYRNELSGKPIFDSSKKRIIENLDYNIAQLEKFSNFKVRLGRAESVQGPGGPQPEIPIISIIVCVVGLLISLGLFSASVVAGIIAIIIIAGIVVYIAKQINYRKEYIDQEVRYNSARREVESLQKQINNLPEIPLQLKND